MDLTDAFRGSAALAAGALTRGVLGGPRYRRLFPDVYAPADLPDDLALRSRAAHVLVEPRGVLSGYSAAELLGASCGSANAPAEVTCPWPRGRLPRLIVHRDEPAADEIVVVNGISLTSPARTAFDLGRRQALVDAVVAVDALTHRHPLGPDELRMMRSRHLGVRGSRRLEQVLEVTDARSESPMETRIRVPLVVAGLPPCVQFPVQIGERAFRLDLAYPSVRLGVEYDGHHHRTPEQARRDLEREALLASAGWKIIRFGAFTVLHRPAQIVERTRAELVSRGW